MKENESESQSIDENSDYPYDIFEETTKDDLVDEIIDKIKSKMQNEDSNDNLDENSERINKMILEVLEDLANNKSNDNRNDDQTDAQTNILNQQSNQYGNPNYQPPMNQFGNPNYQPPMNQYGNPNYQPPMNQYGNPNYQPPMNQYGNPNYQPPMNQYGNPNYQPPMNQYGNPNYQPPINPYSNDNYNIKNNNNPQVNKEDFILDDAPLIEDETIVTTNKSSVMRKFMSCIAVFTVLAIIIGYLQIEQSDNNLDFGGENPTMDIAHTPDSIPSENTNGVLTNNEIHEKVSPSVVGIAVYTKGFGQVLQSEGSGIIMSEDGFIVTNYHVIANNATNPVVKIEIIMPNGDTHEARVIGGDSKTDLAVVKIDAIGLIAAEFGDSSKLKIGDRVAVIGNPSGIAFAGSFTQGCVSALSRNIYMSDLNAEIEYIQTDAAINSGNSGGAFINEYGQVVGISAAKMKVEAGYEGMGFAIPINNAKIVIDSLIEHGYVAGRPKVGIEYKAISPTLAELNSIPIGLRVYTVYEDVDAHNKIFAGDIITMFDGVEVYDSESVATALADKRAGEELLVTIYRVDEETGISEYVDVTIILSESVGEKLAETMN